MHDIYSMYLYINYLKMKRVFNNDYNYMPETIIFQMIKKNLNINLRDIY